MLVHGAAQAPPRPCPSGPSAAFHRPACWPVRYPAPDGACAAERDMGPMVVTSGSPVVWRASTGDDVCGPPIGACRRTGADLRSQDRRCGRGDDDVVSGSTDGGEAVGEAGDAAVVSLVEGLVQGHRRRPDPPAPTGRSSRRTRPGCPRSGTPTSTCSAATPSPHRPAPACGRCATRTATTVRRCPRRPVRRGLVNVKESCPAAVWRDGRVNANARTSGSDGRAGPAS